MSLLGEGVHVFAACRAVVAGQSKPERITSRTCSVQALSGKAATKYSKAEGSSAADSGVLTIFTVRLRPAWGVKMRVLRGATRGPMGPILRLSKLSVTGSCKPRIGPAQRL